MKTPALVEMAQRLTLCWYCANLLNCHGSNGMTRDQQVEQFEDCHINGSIML